MQPSRSEMALRFFAVALLSLVLAAALATGLVQLWPASSFPHARFPPVFVFSTVALLAGSLCLSRAIAAVKRERQGRFRSLLAAALACGTLFVAFQTTALNWLFRHLAPEEASTGAGPFVAVLASLHAMHFVVALLFLSFVSVRAWANRYDHEYYWGVTICAWFWHALGMVWVAILAVITIARW